MSNLKIGLGVLLVALLLGGVLAAPVLAADPTFEEVTRVRRGCWVTGSPQLRAADNGSGRLAISSEPSGLHICWAEARFGW